MLRYVTSLCFSACDTSIGAQLRNAGSTYQLEKLQRVVGVPAICKVVKINNMTPTGNPACSNM